MIDRSQPLPPRQARLLDLSCSSLYYEPGGRSDRDLALLAASFEIHLKFRFYGSQRIRDELLDHGFGVGRAQAAALMRRLGIVPLWPKRKLSKPAFGHKVYPYSTALWRSSGPARCGAWT